VFSSQVSGYVEPLNDTPDIVVVIESIDKSTDVEVSEFVGVAEKGVGDGEELVGEKTRNMGFGDLGFEGFR